MTSGPSIWEQTGIPKPSPEETEACTRESAERDAMQREKYRESDRIRREAEAARDREERAKTEQERLERADRIMGGRYVACTFDNFLLSGDRMIRKRQDSAINAARAYAETINDQIKNGVNLILHGPVGTGKDHIMASIAKYIARASHDVFKRDAFGSLIPRMRFCNGSSLYTDLRSAMHSRTETEARIIELNVAPSVLLLSDPGLPGGAVLTPYQLGALNQIVDSRYQEKRPIICTINAAGPEKLKDTLSAQVADRLLDGAIVIECKWPSYRKPKSVVRDAVAAQC